MYYKDSLKYLRKTSDKMRNACLDTWESAVDIANETENLQDYLEDLQDELTPDDYDDIYHILANLNYLYKYADDAIKRVSSTVIFLDDTYQQNKLF